MSKATEAKAEPTSAVTVVGSYAVMQNAEQLREIMAANVGASGISAFDIDRIKVPAGGGTTFEVPSLEGPQDAKDVTGVIIAWRDARGYWRESFDATGGGTPPDCASDDGVTGIGDPGGDCATCPLAAFGSAMKSNGEAGRAQACKQTRLLFVVREGDLLPILVVVPPSSLGGVRKYFLRLASGAVPFYGVLTRLELAKDRNKDGIAYARIEPSMVGRLSPEESARMKAYAESVAPALAAVRVDHGDVDGPSAA